VSETQEGGEEARDDKNGEEDDEGGSEGRSGHADVALFFVEGLSNSWIHVNDGVVSSILNVKGEVTAGHNLDHFFDPNVSIVFVGHVTTRSAGTSVCGLWRCLRSSIRSFRGAALWRRCVGGWSFGILALVRALVSTDLDGTLEVNFHGVGELEGLEVSVRQDRG